MAEKNEEMPPGESERAEERDSWHRDGDVHSSPGAYGGGSEDEQPQETPSQNGSEIDRS
jgi:hypothetical protein